MAALAFATLALSACGPSRVDAPPASPAAANVTAATPSPTASLVASGNSITNLRMFSATTGWAQRQSDGSVLHTTRGADNWTVESPATGNTQVIATAFVDAQTARVLTAAVGVGDDGIETIQSWATSDGGLQWMKGGTIHTYADGLAWTGSLDFTDSEHGWLSVTGLAAAGSSAILIYRTVNGGAHWDAVDLSNLVPLPAPGKLPSGCDKNPAVFLNASTGWVTAQCDGGSPFFYVTRDGDSHGDLNLSALLGQRTDTPRIRPSSSHAAMASCSVSWGSQLLRRSCS